MKNDGEQENEINEEYDNGIMHDDAKEIAERNNENKKMKSRNYE